MFFGTKNFCNTYFYLTAHLHTDHFKQQTFLQRHFFLFTTYIYIYLNYTHFTDFFLLSVRFTLNCVVLIILPLSHAPLAAVPLIFSSKPWGGTDRQIGRQTDRTTDRQTHRHTDKQIYRQRDRQAATLSLQFLYK